MRSLSVLSRRLEKNVVVASSSRLLHGGGNSSICGYNYNNNNIRRTTLFILIRRSYSIINQYVFPTKVDDEKQIEINKKAEVNREKQIGENMRKQQRLWLAKNSTKTVEATLDVKMFRYVPPMQPKDPRSLKIAIIGAPNAGKSTLVNRFVGSKISAVSTKAHTTRTSTLGICTVGSTQLCFIDTPGVMDNTALTRSTRKIATEAWDSLFESDLVMVLVDSVKTITGNKDLVYIINKISSMQNNADAPTAILVLNKIDLYEKIPSAEKKPVIQRFEKHFPELRKTFREVFLVSALNGVQVIELQNWLVAQAKQREWEFHQDTITPQSQLSLCEEIIREKIFKRVNKEVPYSIKLENIGWTLLPSGTLRIDENLIVRKLGHKKMVLGKKGRGIYGIVETATQDIQALLHRNIDLRLHVKLDKFKYEMEL